MPYRWVRGKSWMELWFLVCVMASRQAKTAMSAAMRISVMDCKRKQSRAMNKLLMSHSFS